MKHLLTLASLWFLLPAPSVTASGMISGIMQKEGSAQFDFFPQTQIRMEAAFDCRFKQDIEDGADFNVWIYCRWTNISTTEAKLVLKDHDSYHGTLDYPWCTSTRITSKQGKVITTNSTFKDNWWNSSAVQAQLSEFMPGDLITLKPSETVVRRVPLQRILFGIDLGEPTSRLPAEGAFTIELKLGDIVASKPLTLRVGTTSSGIH